MVEPPSSIETKLNKGAQLQTFHIQQQQQQRPFNGL